MNPPSPIDFGQWLALLAAQLAPLLPYLLSGATLSHWLAQLDFIKAEKTPDIQKIGAAAGLSLAATILANLITGGYAGGGAPLVYLWSTVQQTGYLFGTMTITNVSLDKLIPAVVSWGATTVTRFIVAVRKGVDTLFNPQSAAAAPGQPFIGQAG